MGRPTRPACGGRARGCVGRARFRRRCAPRLRRRHHGVARRPDARRRPGGHRRIARVVAVTGYRIGVDVGGTFTDLVLTRPDGSIRLEKSPTTPADQSEGVLAGLRLLAAGEGLEVERLLAETDTIVHGTTTG